VELEKRSKETLSYYAPRYIVEINNQVLRADISKAIIEVQIIEKVDEGASFKIQLNDEYDLEKQEFKWLDHPLFEEGNKVKITMGYANALHNMMSGVITTINSSFFTGGVPTFTIEGHDLSFDELKRKRPEETFRKSYSDIAKELAGRAKLNPVVDNTPQFKPSRRKDNDVSYFSFLQDLAKEVSYRLDVDQNNLYFIRQRDEDDAILTLELGKDLISFNPTINTASVHTEVEVRANNPDNPRQPIAVVVNAGDERHQERAKTPASQRVRQRHGENRMVISREVVFSEEHAREIGRAALNESSDNFIKGDGESIGIPQLRKGVNINLEKLGKRFSGKYYVTQTTHTINTSSGYKTNFSVKRNAI